MGESANPVPPHSKPAFSSWLGRYLLDLKLEISWICYTQTFSVNGEDADSFH